MENNVFREKSLERISSPEQLDSYIRVANPDIIILVFAFFVLLIGALVWGIWGNYEKSIKAVAVVSDCKAEIYVDSNCIDEIEVGQGIIIGNIDTKVKMFSDEPVELEKELMNKMPSSDDVRMNVKSFIVYADVDIVDGIYEAEIFTDAGNPFFSFFE